MSKKQFIKDLVNAGEAYSEEKQKVYQPLINTDKLGE